MSDKDGGPAFPVHTGNIETRAGLFPVVGGGMSLRDWFAGQALTAFISNIPPKAIANAEEIANSAYLVADAMLRARTNDGEG